MKTLLDCLFVALGGAVGSGHPGIFIRMTCNALRKVMTPARNATRKQKSATDPHQK